MANRLYVSFWDLCLDNLPQGQFERRVIGAGDAIQMVRIVALAATAIHDEGQIVERPNSTPQPFSCVYTGKFTWRL
jgi:hypothetical protein